MGWGLGTGPGIGWGCTQPSRVLGHPTDLSLGCSLTDAQRLIRAEQKAFHGALTPAGTVDPDVLPFTFVQHHWVRYEGLGSARGPGGCRAGALPTIFGRRGRRIARRRRLPLHPLLGLPTGPELAVPRPNRLKTGQNPSPLWPLQPEDPLGAGPRPLRRLLARLHRRYGRQ